jgi:hypothetical protein
MSLTNRSNEDPWYLHAALYVVIVILVGILIKVAILDPQELIEYEKYIKKESRLRMSNLKHAQILYEKKFGRFTNNLDTLINFIKYDKFVDSIRKGIDPLTKRPSDPFVKLSHGEFSPESLFTTPRTSQRFIVMIDTTITRDTVVTPRGRVLRVDVKTLIGTRYYIEDPDGNGTIGSINNDALKNTASWE